MSVSFDELKLKFNPLLADVFGLIERGCKGGDGNPKKRAFLSENSIISSMIQSRRFNNKKFKSLPIATLVMIQIVDSSC